jgi:DNA-binding transcriptional MerR regulator
VTMVKSRVVPGAETWPMGTGEGHLYSSTELIQGSGCTRKALRYYQDKGLIWTTHSKGSRRYDEVAFHRLRLIVALREIGLSLEEIQALLELHKDHDRPAGPVAQRLADEVGDLVRLVRDRVEALTQIRHSLVAAREGMFACSQCDKLLTACGDCPDAAKLDPTSRILLTGK